MHNPNLDAGELSSIALCAARPGCLLIVDDQAAKIEAQAHGITTIGLVGVLLRAKNKGVLAAVAPELLALRKAGHFLSTALVTKVLTLAGETA